MTTLNQIKGQTIQVLSTDPSPLIEGQIWYNSTSNVWKIVINGVIKTFTTT
jgi:hypothetical protein